MLRHVNLLAILWSLWGALAVLVGISMLLLAGGALAPVLEPGSENIALAAGLTAALFALTGAIAVLWGGAHVLAGLLLRRRLPLGRILSLALAMVNLVVLPFGTALGIYALWVLLTNEGRKLFEPQPLSAAPPL
jgi:hypothetical protein